MPVFSRHVTVDWAGPLKEGGKGVAKAGTGAFNLPVSFLRRIGEPEGVTSPEELIAAAHASCYAMALGRALARGGTPSTNLAVSADVTFDQVGTAWRVVSSHLTVEGTVPGADRQGHLVRVHCFRREPGKIDRHVDLEAGTVRLDPGTTKNRDGRVAYLTPELKVAGSAADCRCRQRRRSR
jgi:osmotically inducible protein OsmC